MERLAYVTVADKCSSIASLRDRLSRILLVDDSRSDTVLIGEALRDAGFTGDIDTAHEPAAALATIASAATPVSVMLLDLHVGNGDGLALLRRMKSTPSLREIPVVAMTDGEDVVTIRQAYQEHANACLVKPTSYVGCLSLAESLVRFWIHTVWALPKP